MFFNSRNRLLNYLLFIFQKNLHVLQLKILKKFKTKINLKFFYMFSLK